MAKPFQYPLILPETGATMAIAIHNVNELQDMNLDSWQIGSSPVWYRFIPPPSVPYPPLVMTLGATGVR